MTKDNTSREEYLDAAQLDTLETNLVREGKTLCGECNKPIRFHHADEVWIDDSDRSHCKGTVSDHAPRAGAHSQPPMTVRSSTWRPE
jgi:hypothetical protein